MSSETNTNSSPEIKKSDEIKQRLIKSKWCMLLCLFLYVLLSVPILIQWEDGFGFDRYAVYPFIVFYCLIEIMLTYRYALNKIGIQAIFRACWERVLDLILKF